MSVYDAKRNEKSTKIFFFKFCFSLSKSFSITKKLWPMINGGVNFDKIKIRYPGKFGDRFGVMYQVFLTLIYSLKSKKFSMKYI